MTPSEAAEALARGALAVDVREPYEWRQGRIAGSLHVPLGELGARLAELPRDRNIVAVCRSGSRSGMVTQALRERGYRIENLDGGLKEWHRQGLPLEPDDARVA